MQRSKDGSSFGYSRDTCGGRYRGEFLFHAYMEEYGKSLTKSRDSCGRKLLVTFDGASLTRRIRRVRGNPRDSEDFYDTDST